MSQETAPAESGSLSAPQAVGCGCLALVGVLLAVVLLPFVLVAWDSRGSTDFPRVAPEERASRAFERSREAYDVLGFERTVEPGGEDTGVGPENGYGTDFCWDGGLLGMDDKTVDGAYRMSHGWALDHVPASQAAPGLRRLHRQLADDGWKVTSYREGGQGEDWELRVQQDDPDERMSFHWDPDREYFTGSAGLPCAYDPDWADDDTEPAGGGQVPPVLGPARG
ncbi:MULTISPECIES: hypothetical protein [unclassified Streptomyces]|uniref:hypothetical protein n=1 Tax=unclassified Streptomyces TaxID=2593676 RepID=UPI002256FDAA|nr:MULTISPECIES: hypothetical protein [unclassified Streptomyces]MCX5332319.1 hypothetical protein [Streptomyces sp. NBC_00140]MCX5361697.1 hypothetical protein [Streptomyces sp. NBC_00124]